MGVQNINVFLPHFSLYGPVDMDRWHFLRPPAKPSIITLSSWGRCWVETRLTSLVGEGLGELLDLQLLKDLFWEAKGSLENKRQSREGPIGCLCTVLSNYKEGSGIPLTRWIGNILQTRYWAKKKKRIKHTLQECDSHDPVECAVTVRQTLEDRSILELNTPENKILIL